MDGDAADGGDEYDEDQGGPEDGDDEQDADGEDVLGTLEPPEDAPHVPRAR